MPLVDGVSSLMVVRKRLIITGPAVAFITTTVFEWKPVLTQDKVANIMVKEIQNTQAIYQLSIISYVIMPSHVHLLLGFSNIASLSKCIQSFKSITSRAIKLLALGELSANDHKLWKPRFDDLIIHSERQQRIKMKYIHNNPVKAGLVKKAEDWRYSSAIDWLTAEHGLIKVDKGYRWLRK